MIILLIVGLIKKTLYKMSKSFPKPYEPFGGNINVRVDLSNYATKYDIKNITHVDTSGFALKTNLANLKSEVDKLDVDKLKPIPTDLSKLSGVVKNDVVRKTDYNKLVPKVDNIDTSGLVKKIAYNTKITEIEGKFPDASSFVRKTDYNSKITEIEDKIPDTSNLATKTALTTVENKIPYTSNLATKTALTTVENKIPDISNLATKTALTTVENKIPYTSNLATKTALTTVENKIPDISNLATKTALNTVENKIPDTNSLVKKNDYNIEIAGIKLNVNRLQAYDLSYFKGKQYFDEGSGKQNYLVFLPMGKYFKLNSVVGVIDRVLSWRSKGISNESIKPPTKSNNSLNPRLSYNDTKIKVKFTGSCLKQPKYTFTHKKIVNIYIVYELGASSSHSSDPTIKNCLFGAVTLTKNADIEKDKYSRYGIGFDSFSFPSGGFGQNVLIFGADKSSSIHIDNKKKDMLVLGRGPTQGLESTLTAEKMYSINFTVTKKKFCLSLHYNRAHNYLFVNGTKIIKFKAKDS